MDGESSKIGRRAVLSGLATTAIAGISSTADAAITCTPFDMNGVQMCDVGITVANNTASQENDQWCWAACIQAVFGFHGHGVSQGRIVDKIFGGHVNSTANGPQILTAVNGTWRDDRGAAFEAAGTVLMDANYGINSPHAVALAAQQLIQNNPLIVGSNGHAMVLTAMRYFADVYGRWQPGSFTVRDPWPLNPNRRMLSQSEVAGATFLAAIQVS